MQGPKVVYVHSVEASDSLITGNVKSYWPCVAEQLGLWNYYWYIKKLASKRVGEQSVDTMLLRLRLVCSPHFLLRTSACLLVQLLLASSQFRASPFTWDPHNLGAIMENIILSATGRLQALPTSMTMKSNSIIRYRLTGATLTYLRFCEVCFVSLRWPK